MKTKAIYLDFSLLIVGVLIFSIFFWLNINGQGPNWPEKITSGNQNKQKASNKKYSRKSKGGGYKSKSKRQNKNWKKAKNRRKNSNLNSHSASKKIYTKSRKSNFSKTSSKQKLSSADYNQKLKVFLKRRLKVKEIKKCDSSLILHDTNPDDMLFSKTFLKRIYSHKYNRDYVAVAEEYNRIANKVKMDKEEYYLEEAIAWEISKNYEKAEKAYQRMLRVNSEYPTGLARYSIFNSVRPNKNISKAEHYIGRAERYAEDKDDKRLVVRAKSEVAFANNNVGRACQILKSNLSSSTAEYICEQFKKNKSNYRDYEPPKAVRRSILYRWRKQGFIPEGSLTEREQLLFYLFRARRLFKKRKYKQGLKLFRQVFKWAMGPAQLSFFLSEYAGMLADRRKYSKAIKIARYAANIEPADYHYGKLLLAYVYYKANKMRYRNKIIKTTNAGLESCEYKVSNCLFQAALNLARVGKREKAIELLKKGKELFFSRAFDRGYYRLKKGRKWP